MTQRQRQIAIFGIMYERKHPEKKMKDITYKEVIKAWLASLTRQTQFLGCYK